MRFTKMQGAGNDYVYVDCFQESVADPAALARAISDRHFGVGSDGLVLICPSKAGDVRMRMFNVDGSESEMCGNAVRCVAKYAYEHGLTKTTPMRVETGAGIKVIELALGTDGKASGATVDMGEPILAPRLIPVNVPGDGPVVDAPLQVGGSAGGQYKMTCVSMGNPHAVVYFGDLKGVSLETLGPKIENHPLFPRRTNVHIVQMHSPGEVTMRTWERGCGITLACGTGASAVCVAGVLSGRTGRTIIAHLSGGDLRLEWREANNHVYMTGAAVEVFTGEWPNL